LIVKKQPLWLFLGYFGLAPFIACLWLFEFPLSSNMFSPQQGFVLYSGLILSFLAGALWQKSASSALQVISNTLCVYAFFCLLLSYLYALLLLPLGYLALLIIEYLWCYKKAQLKTDSYFAMRIALTFIVITLHSFALLRWF
jgi:hypothetical protein